MSECKSESKKWANHLQTTKVKVKNWAKPSRNSTVVKKLPRFMLKCKSESKKWANHLKNRQVKVKNWAKHLETRPLWKSCQDLCPNAKVKVKSGESSQKQKSESEKLGKPCWNSTVAKKLPRFMSEYKSKSEKWANHHKTRKVKVKNWANHLETRPLRKSCQDLCPNAKLLLSKSRRQNFICQDQLGSECLNIIGIFVSISSTLLFCICICVSWQI